MDNGMIYELDLTTSAKKEVGGRTGDMITQLVFDHQFAFLAVGFESGTIQLLNADTFETLETLPGHTANVADIKFSDDDKFLISGGYDRKNFIWNLDRIKKQPISLTDHDSFVWAVGFTPSGNEVISGELNGVMKMYNLEMKFYTNNICNQVSRNLTIKEWGTFVSINIPYQITCLKYK